MMLQSNFYKSSFELFQRLQPQIESLGKEVEKLGNVSINVQLDGVLLKKRKGGGEVWLKWLTFLTLHCF